MSTDTINKNRTNQPTIERDTSDLEVSEAKATLTNAIHRIESAGYHNQFDYKNYGVQYNPIYDKETGRVKTLRESGLSREDYVNLVKLMATSPELEIQWNEERTKQIASNVFDTMYKNNKVLGTDKELFIQKYVEAVKQYNLNDEDFSYEVIKSIYKDAEGASYFK